MSIPAGTISYAATTAAFLFLFLLLVSGWRGRLQGFLLASATLCTALWSAFAAYALARPGSGAPFVAEALEVLRDALWFGFLLVLLGYSRNAVQQLRLAALVIGGICLAVLTLTLYSPGIHGAAPDTMALLGRVVLSVIGMVLIEQLFRNVDRQQRWGIKYLCLGLGGMFVCDFYLYSDALLFRRVNEDIWAARGVIDALVVPLLAVAVSRNPKWSLDISVSRGVLFHSTAIFGAAVYLLVMAAAGYYIRYFGGTWGALLQAAFVFGALQLLLAIVFSGTLRARLKVFLSKNFFSYRFDYREEWLRFTRVLSEGEPGVQLRERSIQAIADLVDSPGGMLWLAQDSGALEPVARWNMPEASAMEAPESTLCQFLEKRQWVINLEEYRRDRDAYAGLQLPDWLLAIPRAWLVVPLILHERLLGFVVLAGSRGRIALDWEVNDLLKTAGRQAASYLAQLEAAGALIVARQFESFNRMSAFVVHDLKNVVAQLSLMLSNSDRHKHKPEFQEDMIDTVSNSVEKMKRLLFQLRGGYTMEPPAPVALGELLGQVVAARGSLRPAPRFEGCAEKPVVLAHRARLERVLGHLVQNAIEATPASGHVVVRLTTRDARAVVSISDTGSGMSEQFIRYRLFKPFESTKSAGMGIGTYETRQYIRELKGQIEVDSAEGRGTEFRVLLPLHQPSTAPAEEVAVGSHV